MKTTMGPKTSIFTAQPLKVACNSAQIMLEMSDGQDYRRQKRDESTSVASKRHLASLLQTIRNVHLQRRS